MKRIKFYIPCEVFEVDIILKPEYSLSSLESYLFQAIDNGMDHLDELTHFFQIGHRPLFVLVSDLWRKGYVHVDLRANKIELTQETRQFMDDKEWLSKIESSTRTESIRLCQELVTGNFLPIVPNITGKVNRYLVTPRVINFGDYRKHCIENISSVIKEKAIKHRSIMANSELVGASLKLNKVIDGVIPVHQRLLECEAHCLSMPGGGISLSIVSPSEVKGRTLLELENKLALLSAEMPENPFFKYLHDKAESSGDLSRPTLTELVDKIDRKIGILETCGTPPQKLHGELSNLAQTALNLFMNLWEEQAEIELIPNIDKLEIKIKEEISKTRQQFVFACPFADHGINKFRPQIEEALTKEAQGLILWGQNSEDRLSDHVFRVFMSLSGIGPFQILKRPTRLNERYFIRDGDCAILSTVPFLGQTSKRKLSFSVVIEKPSNFQYSRFINSQLDRIYRIIPELKVLHKFKRYFTDTEKESTNSGYCSMIDNMSQEEQENMLRRIEKLPSPPLLSSKKGWGEYASSFDTANFDIWKSNWLSWQNAMKSGIAQIRNTIEPIYDRQHLELLYQACLADVEFIIIGTEYLSYSGFDQEIEELFNFTLQQNKSIILIYGDKSSNDLLVHKRIERLEKDWSGKFSTFNISCYGGFIISGVSLILSSCSLLSEQRQQKERKFETGVLIQSSGLVSQTLQIIATHIPDLKCFAKEFNDVKEDSQGTQPIKFDAETEIETSFMNEFLSELSELEASNDPHKQFRQFSISWFMEHFSLFTSKSTQFSKLPNYQLLFDFLDQLVSVLPFELKEYAVVGCLYSSNSHEVTCCSNSYQKWVSWLAWKRWQDGRFFETELLMRGLESRTGDKIKFLHPLIIKLAAYDSQNDLYDQQKIENTVTSLALEILDDRLCESDLLAGFFLSSKWLLIDGLNIGEEILNSSLKKLPGIYEVWSQAVWDYWQETGGRPLPVRHLESSITITEIKMDATRAYNRFVETLVQSCRVNPKAHVIVHSTWSYLLKPDQFLGRMEKLGNEGNWRGVRKVVKDLEAKYSQIGKFLDHTCQKVAGENKIIGPKRSSCVKKLRDLIKASWDWIQLEIDLDGKDINVESHIKIASDLQLKLEHSWDKFESDNRKWEKEMAPLAPLSKMFYKHFHFGARSGKAYE